MKAFASLLSSKKKQSLSTQLDASTNGQSQVPLPFPGRETHTGHPKNYGTRVGSASTAPFITRDDVAFQHDRGGPTPSQPRHDAYSSSRYLTPPALPLASSKGPPKSSKSKPSFFLQPRLNKSTAHVDAEAVQRSSWMTNSSDPFAAPSCSTLQQPSANHPLSVPPPPIPPRHEPACEHRPQLNGHLPLSFKRDGPGTNDVVLASNLYKRRRARSVGCSGAPAPNFLVNHATLPPIPNIIPLRLTKDVRPVPKQLPTPITPSAPTPISMQMHSRVLSDSSTRSMAHKKSLPCIEGVWNDFLKEVEEDIESLTMGRSEKELPPPSPPKSPSPKRPLPLPTCRPRSKTLGSSTIIEKGLPSPGPLTPLRTCFPPMPIIVTPSISKEDEDSSVLPPSGMAAPQSKPTSVLDIGESQSISMLPYLGSESSMTTGSDLSLSLFPSPPSVPVMRPTNAKGILRTRLTQPPHPPPNRPIPPTPSPHEGQPVPASTAVSQEKGVTLSPLLELPVTPEIRLPEFSTMINSSDDKALETPSIVCLSRSNSAELHTPTRRPGPSVLGPTLHVPASATSSTPSLTHSQHSYQSSTSSCTSVTTDYSSLLHSLEDARISVASNTSSLYTHADLFVVPSADVGSRTTTIDKSVYGHARADALGGLKALNSAARLTDLNPRTGSAETPTEPKPQFGGDTFEWGYAL